MAKIVTKLNSGLNLTNPSGYLTLSPLKKKILWLLTITTLIALIKIVYQICKYEKILCATQIAQPTFSNPLIDQAPVATSSQREDKYTIAPKINAAPLVVINNCLLVNNIQANHLIPPKTQDIVTPTTFTKFSSLVPSITKHTPKRCRTKPSFWGNNLKARKKPASTLFSKKSNKVLQKPVYSFKIPHFEPELPHATPPKEKLSGESFKNYHLLCFLPSEQSFTPEAAPTEKLQKFK